jgi:ankyrin repeat protein
MSRFASVPQVTVPSDVVNNFFLALSQGDVDFVRQFVAQYKNSVNIFSTTEKDKPSISKQSPFHTVLSLDPLVANDDAKLQLMKYLADLGAPMDVPNSANIWPIHIAAENGNLTAVQFLVDHGVDISRLDSSGNTALHYAIYGKQVDCKAQSLKPGALTDTTTSSSQNFNVALENAKLKTQQILSANPVFTSDLIHMINTIKNIPQKTIFDPNYRQMQGELNRIFVNAAYDPTYSSSFPGGSPQQTNLEALMSTWENFYSENVFKSMSADSNFRTGAPGWGPQIAGTVDPQNRILEKSLQNYLDDMTRARDQARSLVISEVNAQTPSAVGTQQLAAGLTTLFTGTILEALGRGSNGPMYGGSIFVLMAIEWLTENSTAFLSEMISRNFCIMNQSGITSLTTGGAYPTIPDEQLITNTNAQIFAKLITTYPSANPNHLQLMANAATATATDTIKEGVMYAICAPNSYRRGGIASFFPNTYGLRPLTVANSILNQPLANQEFIDESQRLFTSKRLDPTLNWMENVRRLIKKIQPKVSNSSVQNIFVVNNTTSESSGSGAPARPYAPGSIWPVTATRKVGDYEIPLRPFLYTETDAAGVTRPVVFRNVLPVVPVTTETAGLDSYDSSIANYTLWDASRVMDMLGQAIVTGTYSPTKLNNFFVNQGGSPIMINDMMQIVDYYNEAAGRVYPEYVQLAKILINAIQTYSRLTIQATINQIIVSAPTAVLPPANFTDLDLFSVAAPSLPTDVSDPTLTPFKSNLITGLGPNPDLFYQSFDRFVRDLSVPGIYPRAALDYSVYDVLVNIYISTDPNLKANPNYLAEIKNRTYDLLRKPGPDVQSNLERIVTSDAYENGPESVFTQNKIDNFEQALRHMKFETIDQVIPEALTIMQNNSFISAYDIIVYQLIVNAYQSYGQITAKSQGISDIVSDIRSAIRDETYLWIPQIYLPALIIKTISIAADISSLKDIPIDYNEGSDVLVKGSVGSDLYNVYQNFKNRMTNLTVLANDFIKNVTVYHNNVINFLNLNSALVIAKANTSSGVITLDGLFDKVLTNLDVDVKIVPNSREMASFDFYGVGEIMYYALPTDTTQLDYNSFKDSTNSITAYKDFMDYTRTGTKISDLPSVGLNSQLNVVVSSKTILQIPHGFSGPWLAINSANIVNSKYFDALIGYSTSPFTYDPIKGAPASIAPFAGLYLQMKRQDLVQKFVQYVVDNKDNTASQLWADVQQTLTQPGILQPGPAASYIVLAHLAEDHINRLLTFTLRQTIGSWIYDSTSGSTYGPLMDPIKATIATINTAASNVVEPSKIDINNLITGSATYKYEILNPVESNLKTIKYTSPSEKANQSTTFIHYVANIAIGQEESLGQCYQIDPQIVDLLIDGRTLNQKNMSGQTPVALALALGNMKLVDMLAAKGGLVGTNTVSAKQSVENLKKHLAYTKSSINNRSVEQSIGNFVLAFNDMLISRLNTPSANNNILKNVTDGIPFSLIMYNHLYHLGLQNYRYGFTIELKEKINSIIKPYVKTDIDIYPWDLYEVDNSTNLLDESGVQIQNLKTITNSKLEQNLKQQSDLQTQIANLQAEQAKTTPENRQILEQFITGLRTRLADLERARLALIAPVNRSSTSTSLNSGFYKVAITSAKNNLATRSMSLVPFYEYVDAKIGPYAQIHISIWENYLGKQLPYAESMIFSQLENVMNQILSNNIDSTTLSVLTPIRDFYAKVSEQIASVDIYPKVYDELTNPMFTEEINEIIYLIKLVLTPSVIDLVYKQLDMDLGTIASGATTTRSDLMNSIINNKFNGETIGSYIRTKLPIAAYKYFTTTYDQLDPTRKVNVDSDLFVPITQIITTNTVISLPPDSVVVTNFKNVLVPLLSNTYRNFIHHIKLARYAYSTYIQKTKSLLDLVIATNS